MPVPILAGRALSGQAHSPTCQAAGLCGQGCGCSSCRDQGWATCPCPASGWPSQLRHVYALISGPAHCPQSSGADTEARVGGHVGRGQGALESAPVPCWPHLRGQVPILPHGPAPLSLRGPAVGGRHSPTGFCPCSRGPAWAGAGFWALEHGSRPLIKHPGLRRAGREADPPGQGARAPQVAGGHQRLCKVVTPHPPGWGSRERGCS